MPIPEAEAARFSSCTLQIILEGQGPTAVREVLESFGPPGENLRQHARMCLRCAGIVRQLYGEEDVPVAEDPLAPELLETLKTLD